MKGRATEIDARIGRRIRMRRMDVGISQEELADHLSLTFQQVQKFEKGMNRVSVSHLFRIAAVLRVPVAFFFRDIEKADPLEDFSQPVRHLLMSREGLALARDFSRVKSANMRAKVIALTKTLAESQA